MKEVVTSAFETTRQGFSSDRVLADPQLRRLFLDECAVLSLTETEEVICRTLLNLRKAGRLSHLRSTTTRFQDEEYRFASEIAVRHLERRDQVTVDDILCDPALLADFDSICEGLAPGYSALRYRWAALSLRKSRSVPPEIIGQALASEDVEFAKCSELDLERIKPVAGIYIFIGPSETLYVGEASNLRVRLAKHLEHSDNKHLARYIWDRGIDEVRLEIHYLPETYSTKVRKALETELIRSREPAFNILGKLV